MVDNWVGPEIVSRASDPPRRKEGGESVYEQAFSVKARLDQTTVRHIVGAF